MSTVLPELYSKGLFTFTTPFDTITGVLECKAIRSFEEIYNANIDVYKAYYETNSLDVAAFNTDRANKVSIVTFTKNTGEFVNIPSSYIAKIPSGGTVAYSHVVLSASLSSVPDALDLDAVVADVISAVTARLGLTPVVELHKAPTLPGSVVTDAQHAILETARNAAITNQTTERARLIQMTNAYNALKAEYDALAQAVADGTV